MLVIKKLKHNFSNSFFKASVIVVLFVMSLIISPANNIPVYANPQDDLNAINSQLDATNKSLEVKQSEVKTLGDQVNVLNEQINQIGLQIQATQTKIQILKQQITQTEVDLKTQQETLNEYLRVIYEESNTSPLEQIASANSFSEFVDKSEYLQTMQVKIRDTVDKIKQMKADLEKSKKETEKMKDQLNSQKSDLSGKKSAQSALLIMAQNNAAALQQSANDLISKKGVLSCIIHGGCGGDPNGDLVIANTSPHYYQWDSRWNVIPVRSSFGGPLNITMNMGDVGCLTTSYAMLRTMLGNTTDPKTEAQNYHTYGPGGWMTSSGDFVGHREISLGTNWNSINTYLDSKKPVLVQLAMGGYEHWVVLTGHNGSKYTVNDPYFEGGTYNTSRVMQAISY